MTSPPPLSISQIATLACVLEATAPKVGNVHRGADFEDLTLPDFLVSAIAVGPILENAAAAGVGRTVLNAITATRQLVTTNTNLGMVLLLAPLAAMPRGEPLTIDSVHRVLSSLTPDDSRLVYEAIRLAQPGGLGKVEEMDVAAAPPDDLLAAMHAAANRDLVARQYAEDFCLVLGEVLPLLQAGRAQGWSLTEAIVHTQVSLLADHDDSLIARKCGPEVARQASAIAGQVLACGGPGDEAYYEALADFDFWLRSDGHRRNPGTTADLIAAALFAGLREGLLMPPWR
ncbi:MAG: triphosphoribosyl-dephospho-CoA synthase [Pirellulaceae bacterium]|nr:triphosphoribosyl-dephospho-CoA synthase [Pirellulaceae bacterium]